MLNVPDFQTGAVVFSKLSMLHSERPINKVPLGIGNCEHHRGKATGDFYVASSYRKRKKKNIIASGHRVYLLYYRFSCIPYLIFVYKCSIKFSKRIQPVGIWVKEPGAYEDAKSNAVDFSLQSVREFSSELSRCFYYSEQPVVYVPSAVKTQSEISFARHLYQLQSIYSTYTEKIRPFWRLNRSC